jgi:hypothetical protein
MLSWLFALAAVAGLAQEPATQAVRIRPAAEPPLFGSASGQPAPAPKVAKPNPDAPDDELEGPNLASELFQLRCAQIVAATEKGRESEGETEPVDGGLRIVCNLTGRRFECRLTGAAIEDLDDNVWRVDGRLLILKIVDPPPPSVPVGPTARELLEQVRDENLKSLREEQNAELVPGTDAWLTLPTGEPVWYGEVVSKLQGDAEPDLRIVRMLLGQTVRNRHIVAMAVPVTNPSELEESRKLLRQSILSVKPLQDLPPDRAPLTAQDVLNRGMTLEQNLRLMHEMIPDTSFGALVNRQITAAHDRSLEGVRALAPDRLIAVLKVALGRWQIAPDLPALLDPDSPIGNPMMISVYDGQTGHALQLVAFDRRNDRFVVQEVWRTGSFLQRANNEAGVDAKPFGTRIKEFTVTPDELQRVLYAVTLEDEDMHFAGHVADWLDAEGPGLAAALKTLERDQPDDPALGARALFAVGFHLLNMGATDRAAALFEACHEFHPESALACYGLAQVARAKGRAEESAAWIGDARARLADDPALHPLLRDWLNGQLDSPRPGAPAPKPGQ